VRSLLLLRFVFDVLRMPECFDGVKDYFDINRN